MHKSRGGVIVIVLVYRIAGRKDERLRLTDKFGINDADYRVISGLAQH